MPGFWRAEVWSFLGRMSKGLEISGICRMDFWVCWDFGFSPMSLSHRDLQPFRLEEMFFSNFFRKPLGNQHGFLSSGSTVVGVLALLL